MRLILASGSPRRRELLELAGLRLEVVPSRAEELHTSALPPAALCEENARLKAAEVAHRHPQDCVIGADTLVFLDDLPLGKPRSRKQAAEMLRTLSGRSHRVISGVCVISPRFGCRTFHAVTTVHFHPLNEESIASYHALVDPLDKAGGYAIQEHGELVVASIIGPFDNVMGLPMQPLLAALRDEEIS